MLKLKKFKTLSFASGETKSEKLPGNNLLSGIILDLSGSLVISGGSSDPAAVQDHPATLFKTIKVMLGGKEQYRLSGIDAYWYSYLMYGEKPAITQMTISGAATYAFAVQIPIDFQGPGSLDPQRSLLRTVADLDPQIEVEWGTTADLATGGDRTLAFSGVVCNILVEYETEGHKPSLFRSMVSNQVTVSAASTALGLPLTFGKGIHFRTIFIRAMLAGVRSNALLNNVILKIGAGDDHIVNLPASNLQREAQTRLKLKGTEYPAGIYVINFDRYKVWKGLLPGEDVGEVSLEFDVAAPSGTTFVKAVPELVRKL